MLDFFDSTDLLYDLTDDQIATVLSTATQNNWLHLFVSPALAKGLDITPKRVPHIPTKDEAIKNLQISAKQESGSPITPQQIELLIKQEIGRIEQRKNLESSAIDPEDPLEDLGADRKKSLADLADSEGWTLYLFDTLITPEEIERIQYRFDIGDTQLMLPNLRVHDGVLGARIVSSELFQDNLDYYLAEAREVRCLYIDAIAATAVSGSYEMDGVDKGPIIKKIAELLPPNNQNILLIIGNDPPMGLSAYGLRPIGTNLSRIKKSHIQNTNQGDIECVKIINALIKKRHKYGKTSRTGHSSFLEGVRDDALCMEVLGFCEAARVFKGSLKSPGPITFEGDLRTLLAHPEEYSAKERRDILRTAVITINNQNIPLLDSKRIAKALDGVAPGDNSKISEQMKQGIQRIGEIETAPTLNTNMCHAAYLYKEVEIGRHVRRISLITQLAAEKIYDGGRIMRAACERANALAHNYYNVRHWPFDSTCIYKTAPDIAEYGKTPAHPWLQDFWYQNESKMAQLPPSVEYKLISMLYKHSGDYDPENFENQEAYNAKLTQLLDDCLQEPPGQQSQKLLGRSLHVRFEAANRSFLRSLSNMRTALNDTLHGRSADAFYAPFNDLSKNILVKLSDAGLAYSERVRIAPYLKELENADKKGGLITAFIRFAEMAGRDASIAAWADQSFTRYHMLKPEIQKLIDETLSNPSYASLHGFAERLEQKLHKAEPVIARLKQERTMQISGEAAKAAKLAQKNLKGHLIARGMKGRNMQTLGPIISNLNVEEVKHLTDQIDAVIDGRMDLSQLPEGFQAPLSTCLKPTHDEEFIPSPK